MNLFQVTKKQPSSGLELKTFTGNPVTFTPKYSEALPAPFNGVNLKAAILATGGNGTPSTPIPIVGHSEIHIWNNANENRFSGAFDTIVPIYLPAGATVCASCSWYDSGDVKFRYYRADGTEIDYWGVAIADTTNNRKYRTFVMTEDAYFGKFEGTSVTDLMVIIGNTSKPYQPYNGTPYLVSFGQTVYGGEYDANRGKIRLTKGTTPISKDWNWVKSSSYDGAFYVYVDDIPTYNIKKNVPFTCSHLQSITSISNYVYGTCLNDSALNFFIMPTGSTMQDFKDFIDAQALANTPIQICYELATAIEIDVSELSVEAVSGVNNIVSDGGGDIEVKCLI